MTIKVVLKGLSTLVGAFFVIREAYSAYLAVKIVREQTGSLKHELVLYAVLVAAALSMLWLALRWWRLPWLKPVNSLQCRLGWPLYWAGVVGIGTFFTVFFGYSQYGPVSVNPSIRWVALLGVTALVACLTPPVPTDPVPTDRMDGNPFPWTEYLAGMALLGAGVSFVAALQAAGDYPFQYGWSEGNRFWDYSVLYGRRLYLYPPDQPLNAFIDPGRQSLWGLPFLLIDPTIQQMRLWSILVFSVPYALLGWMIFRPGSPKRVAQWAVLGLWSFLFLDQGPIYTPLVLSAILVVGGRRRPFWLNLALVVMAGYYAQISRYTWMFAPAMWAAVIAFVEPYPRQAARRELDRDGRNRWLRAGALGFAGALGGFVAPRLIPWLVSWFDQAQAGQPAVLDTGLKETITRQPLLWERLLPNSTYALGILPALLLAVGPLLILVMYWLYFTPRGGAIRFSLWQKLAVTVMLGLFLAVGVVASVKIGGGSNLHNLDMFLLGLLMVTGLIWEAGAASWLEKGALRPTWATWMIFAMVFIPFAQTALVMEPRVYPESKLVSEGLASIQKKVAAAQQCNGGEVLFIDQRQLLTFGYVRNLPLIPEYEKKLMMDKAMAEDAAYFEPFYQDLERQRFSMIVVEPLQTHYQGEDFQFSNENDAWVKWVSRPILKQYREVETHWSLGIQFLIPIGKSCRGIPK